MKNRKKPIFGRIVQNKLSSVRYLESVSVGLTPGTEVILLGKTPFQDYMLVQVHKKIFAIPSEMIEKIEVLP